MKKSIRYITAALIPAMVLVMAGCNKPEPVPKQTTVTKAVVTTTAAPSTTTGPATEAASVTTAAPVTTTVLQTATETRQQTAAATQKQTTTTTTQKRVGYSEEDAQRFCAEAEAYAVSIGMTVDHSLSADNSSWDNGSYLCSNGGWDYWMSITRRDIDDYYPRDTLIHVVYSPAAKNPHTGEQEWYIVMYHA